MGGEFEEGGGAPEGESHNHPASEVAETAKSLTEAIADTFEKADRVLKGVLDGLALQFKTSAPAFYADYENARAIVDHSATVPEKSAPVAA